MCLISFEDALEATKDSDRSLLLGNGFSIAQTEGDFAYSNLLEKSGFQDESCFKVFEEFKTVDFEEVIKALEQASKVSKAYANTQQAEEYQQDAQFIREGLIQAIQDSHPEDFSKLPENEIESCVKFLKEFSPIFTLNYDLLLYWVALQSRSFKDGFGLGKKSKGFLGPFKEGADCSVYNIHGGLHLFLGLRQDVYKKVGQSNNLLAEITSTISDGKRLPLYVAEGTYIQKLGKIRSVPYLEYCYKKLERAKGNLFVFGHSIIDENTGLFNEKDRHIYDAVFSSDVKAVYYCLYDTTNFLKVKEAFAPFHERRPKIEIKYIDASQMDIWGKNNDQL